MTASQIGRTPIIPPEQLMASLRETRHIPDDVQSVHDLTPADESLLFQQLLWKRPSPAERSVIFEMSSRVSVIRLAQAVQRLSDYYANLRSLVLWHGLEKFARVVLQNSTPTLIEDASAWDGDPIDHALRRLASHPIDPRVGPPLRLCAASSSDGTRIYTVLQASAIACDETSFRKLIADACALTENPSLTVTAPSMTQDPGAVRAAKRNPPFFATRLGDVTEPSAPFGLIHSSHDDRHSNVVTSKFPGSLVWRARLHARRLNVSTASILSAAWLIVVARTSARDDVVIGVTLPAPAGIDPLRTLGTFENVLPLRGRLDDCAADRFVTNVESELTQLLQYRHVPYCFAHQSSGLREDSPLFTGVINIREDKNVAWSRRAADIEPIARFVANDTHLIDLTVDCHADEFFVHVQTTPRIDAARISAYLSTALVALLDALDMPSSHPVSELSILLPGEEQRLLWHLNETDAPYSHDRMVHQLFEDRVAVDPKAVAVDADDACITYGQLNDEANRLARHLQQCGVRARTRIALCMDRGAGMIVALMAILKAGGTYVPMDPTYPPQRLAFILKDSHCSILIQHRATKIMMEQTMQCFQEALLVIDTDQDRHRWANLPIGNLHTPGSASQDTAYVIYTSGSTGQPKGIPVAHAPAINVIEWVNTTFGVNRDDVLLFVTSISFDLSVYDIFGMLAAGGSIRVATTTLLRDPEQLSEILCNQRITIWDSAPATLQMLMPVLSRKDTRGSTLRLILNSGDWIPVSLPSICRALFPCSRFISLGGATEATIWSNWYEVERVRPHWNSIPYGRPIQNARYYILDDGLRPVPMDVAGGLYIGGKCLAEGYTSPALTEERFIASPFVAGERLFRTGDVARYMADDNIEFLGRSDFQVKIRGYRIELGEIEAQLLRHPEILQATILAHGKATSDRKLIAYYVAAAGGKISAHGLRAHLSSLLPLYMVPSTYIELAALPVNSNGKIDRHVLLALAEEISMNDHSTSHPRPEEINREALDELLLSMQRKCVHLWIQGRHLHYRSFPGFLNPREKALLQSSQTAIVAKLMSSA